PNSLVTFFTGPNPEFHKFTIHKEVTCYHSPVLRAAFESDFIEGQTQAYRLEETTKGAFEMFSSWLYSEQVDAYQLKIGVVWPELEYTPKREDLDLVELWVLAEKLLVPKLQDMVIDALEDIRMARGLVEDCYKLVYERTNEDSVLRAYFVRCAAMDYTRESFDRKVIPVVMFADIADWLSVHWPDPGVSDELGVKYYVSVHDDEWDDS
ncbi:hypothetical protein B0J14DRAFT_484605, partial [Halenospora varia]